MPEELSKHDQILLTLAMNLQGGAMMQMGKMADPVSGEVNRNLEGARYAIDVLEMLQAKSRDNTDKEIVGVLDRMVMDLQLNYMDEIKKDQAQPAEESADEAPAEEEKPEEEASDGEQA